MCSTIEYLRDFLIRYDYPSGDMHDDSSFSDVFVESNRQFLLRWTMGVYLGEEVGWDGLPERLVEMGFVDEADRDAFAAATMEPEKNLQVFKNMFQFIRVVKEPALEASVEEIHPELPETDQMFQDYLERIESRLQRPEPHKPHLEVRPPVANQIFQDSVLQVDSELQRLEETRKIITQVDRSDKAVELVFPQDFSSTVTKCKMLLESFHQYVKDVMTVGNFLEGSVVSDSVPEIGESSAVSFLEDVADTLITIRDIKNK